MVLQSHQSPLQQGLTRWRYLRVARVWTRLPSPDQKTISGGRECRENFVKFTADVCTLGGIKIVGGSRIGA